MKKNLTFFQPYFTGVILAVGIVFAYIAITMSGASAGVSELSCGGMALTKKLYGLLKEEAGNSGEFLFICEFYILFSGSNVAFILLLVLSYYFQYLSI